MTFSSNDKNIWIKMIIDNNLSINDVSNLRLTCKYFANILTVTINTLKKTKINNFLKTYEIKHSHYSNRVSFSNDNKYMSVIEFKGYDAFHPNHLKIIDIENKNIIHKFPKCNNVEFVTFHPRCSDIIAYISHKGFYIYNFKTKIKITKSYVTDEHIQGVSSIVFHPTKNLILCGEEGGKISIWNFKRSLQDLTERGKYVSSMKFSNDGKFLYVNRGNEYSIWEYETLTLKKTIIIGEYSELLNTEIVIYNETGFEIFDFLTETKISYNLRSKLSCIRYIDHNKNFVLISGNGLEIFKKDKDLTLIYSNYDDKDCRASFSPNNLLIAHSTMCKLDITSIDNILEKKL